MFKANKENIAFKNRLSFILINYLHDLNYFSRLNTFNLAREENLA